MGNGLIWKIERQPSWPAVAIKRTITDLPGGYAEMAEWSGMTENALFNRLRASDDQIFPLGWVMILQRAGGSTHIVDVAMHHSQGILVPLADADDLDNTGINQRPMELTERIGRHSNFVCKATADGVIDADEHTQVEEGSHQVIVKFREHVALLYRVFYAAEKSDARERAVPDASTNNSSSMEK